MSRLIVSNIETQNIKFDSDTTAFSINSSGQLNTSSIVVRGEGTATTNLQQGLLKHFGTMQGTDTFAGSIDSFNQASATDHGTGDHSVTNTSAFRESRPIRQVYTHNTANEGSSALAGANRAGTHSSGNGGAAPTTTVFRFNVMKGSSSDSDGAAVDLSYVYIIGAGDLA